MGVIYKLKPEIKDLILDKKRANPSLSCRSLASLIDKELNIKVSKSSINFIIKEAGLSLPVGRRRKRMRMRRREMPGIYNSGAVLLKAADYLIGGSHYLTESIKNRLNYPGEDLSSKIESLIYGPLFNLPANTLSSFFNEVKQIKALPLDISRLLSTLFQEVRCARVTLLDGTTFYLDSQLYTVWSTPQIPYDFSAPVHNIKSCLNKCFQEEGPFVLFTAPGYDTPTKEFFDFMLGLDSTERGVSRLTLYGNKFEELETMRLEPTKRQYFVFGFWPWQFRECRKVNKVGEFRPFYFEPLEKDLYLAPIEMELWQPHLNKRITLRGAALKTNLEEKIRLIILSNLPTEKIDLEGLANLYLNHWPNLEEAFQDFSRKIELFTYTAGSQRFFSSEAIGLNPQASSDISSLPTLYLRALDLYVKWHFLPAGYEDEDFSRIKEQFYDLKARIKKQNDLILVTFPSPSQPQLLKDLEYALRRINEREIVSDGKRLWFNLQ